MTQSTLRINAMLLSNDDEMRELGRVLTRSLSIKTTDIYEKSLLLLNSNHSVLVQEGASLFLRKKRNMISWERLLNSFKQYGFQSTTMYGLQTIVYSYRRTKKIAGYFEEIDYLHKQFKDYKPSRSSHYDDLKDNYTR